MSKFLMSGFYLIKYARQTLKMEKSLLSNEMILSVFVESTTTGHGEMSQLSVVVIK